MKEGDPTINRLRFFRYLADNGRLEHRPVGMPKGEFVFKLPNEEIARFVRLEAQAQRPALGLAKAEALRQHLEATGDY